MGGMHDSRHWQAYGWPNQALFQRAIDMGLADPYDDYAEWKFANRKSFEEVQAQMDAEKGSVKTRKQRVGYGYHNMECAGEEWEMVVGEVYATRSWNIDKAGRLVSPQQHHVWRPGENVADGHGFYAYTDKPEWPGEVKGIVKAYGKVTEGTRGIVAEKAEIVALVDPNALNDKGVISKVLNLPGRLTAKYVHKASKSNLGVAVTIFSCIVAMTLAGVFGFTLSPFFAVLGVLGLWTLISSLCNTTFDHDSVWNVEGKSKITKLYPNVKVYKSQSKMLKDYGLPKKWFVKEIPDPDSDEFWTASESDLLP